ncbi:MAG: xylose isomerase [Ilumatobacter sp.]|uniref:xylose isomerase n=1 Tax=Ilumatobacter sp. TaxID=1967498 RepID=UPI0032995D07
MTDAFFPDIERIAYEGRDSDNPLAFRWYDADRVVGDRTMAEHLRFGVCYWHSFAWDGSDIFGAGTLDRPWNPATASGAAAGMEPMAAAKSKMAAAFEFFEKLGAPFFAFHDVDIAPAGSTFRESSRNLDEMVDEAAAHMERTGTKLLWGTTNAFSHPRFMAGAATNPDPAMFRYAAAQVVSCMNATNRLGGANYVLWGGREGYETLLNTDMKREIDQLGRFMNMVVEHKYAIGFDGALLIEPKPMEPTKHQYDYDVATVYAFLQKYGLENEIKVNIEVNHATLSGHDFHHEVATAVNNGIFGSIDANAGDDRLGWDLDMFPRSVEQMTLGMLEILRGGGFTTGGLMFDTKLRRQSTDRNDLFHGHIGAMDVLARSLLAAQRLLDVGELEQCRAARYAGWNDADGAAIMNGEITLAELHEQRLADDVEPITQSGRQEYLENIVARTIERTI